ncbi:hypothetical protein [Streptomyces tauricus]|uniref:hypothetical protein n=1 Tax=Streptomyces tauricus TaxID=68274 RepID=UPI00380981CB
MIHTVRVVFEGRQAMSTDRPTALAALHEVAFAGAPSVPVEARLRHGPGTSGPTPPCHRDVHRLR